MPYLIYGIIGIWLLGFPHFIYKHDWISLIITGVGAFCFWANGYLFGRNMKG